MQHCDALFRPAPGPGCASIEDARNGGSAAGFGWGFLTGALDRALEKFAVPALKCSHSHGLTISRASRVMRGRARARVRATLFCEFVRFFLRDRKVKGNSSHAGLTVGGLAREGISSGVDNG